MSRKFVNLSEKELYDKIGVVLEDGNPLRDEFGKDLKVDFDFENFTYRNDFGPKDLVGYRTLNGFAFCGCCAGGDWEFPCYFLIYFDGRKLRAYVPTDGNPWNTKTKRAYGNDPEADFVNIKKRWPELLTNKQYDDEFDAQDFVEFNTELIKADIVKRFSL